MRILLRNNFLHSNFNINEIFYYKPVGKLDNPAGYHIHKLLQNFLEIKNHSLNIDSLVYLK